MKPMVKMGLLVGIIALVPNMLISALLGVCGPFVILIAGAIAGFLTAQQEKPTLQADGARVGAISGLIAGLLAAVGQLLGGVLVLAVVQFSGMKIAFGTVPPPSATASQQILYYLSGVGTSVCFGLFGLLLAAGAGALAGYLGTPKAPQPQVSP